MMLFLEVVQCVIGVRFLKCADKGFHHVDGCVSGV